MPLWSAIDVCLLCLDFVAFIVWWMDLTIEDLINDTSLVGTIGVSFRQIQDDVDALDTVLTAFELKYGRILTDDYRDYVKTNWKHFYHSMRALTCRARMRLVFDESDSE